MTTPVSHPLVGAYLRDLELLLRGIEPGERAEVLAGVHEHLEASLAPDPSDEDVRGTLAELGSPQSVADEAYAGRPAPGSGPRHAGSRWTGLVATGINAVCVVLLLVLVTLGTPHPCELVFAFSLVLLLPWLAVSVLTALTARWTGRERALSTLLLPGTVLVLTIALWVLLALGAPYGLRLVPALAVLGAVTWAVLVLGHSARR